MRKFNLKSLLYYTLIPLMLAFTVSMLIPSYSDFYSKLIKPVDVKPIDFIVVWSILYILMGISAYLIDNSGNEYIKSSLILYYTQLFLNLLWPIVFFGMKKLLLSSGIIVLLDILVMILIIKFYRIRKSAGYLLIPYIIWLLFASYLNISIYYLNK